MLAPDRGREGTPRRARRGGGAPGPRRERHAVAGGRELIVDSLTFLGESLFGLRATEAELLGSLDELEVGRAVVCPLRPAGYQLAPANELVAEAVRAHPERLVGFGRVDPNLGEEACAEAERCLGELGLRGLFLHPWEETFRVSAPIVDPVIEVVRERGAPVIVAAGYPWLSEGLQVGELARRFPDVAFVATNGGQISVSGLGQTDVELALSRCPNLAVQTTAVYREDFLERAVATFGAHRLLYASGFPHFEPRLELLRPRFMHIDEADRAAVLGGNAARLLAR